MRSDVPSESATVPLPDHDPLKPANGPDWAWLTDTDNMSAAPTPAAVIACPNKPEPNNFISNFPIQMTFLYEPRFPRYLQPKPIIVVRRTSVTAYHGRAEPCTRIKHLFTCRSQYHMHLFDSPHHWSWHICPRNLRLDPHIAPRLSLLLPVN